MSRFIKLMLTLGAISATVFTMTSCSDDDDGDNAGASDKFALGAQIDRTGRPAVSTGLIKSMIYTDQADKNATKDSYNAAGIADWAGFATELRTHIAVLDSLDECSTVQAEDGDPTTTTSSLAFNTLGNDAYGTLTAVLTDDRLYVNTNNSDCEDSYLALEIDVATEATTPTTKCGGRNPNIDVIDITYSALATGTFDLNVEDELGVVKDGVPADDAEHSLTAFPFIAAPL